LRLDIPENHIPFEKRSTSMTISNSIHLDLYRFFSITAIRNYAFQGKYKDVDLNTVSKLLLKEGKLNQEHKWVGDMSYRELVNYCIKDAELTYRLSTVDNNLVMNLMLAIVRISKMPIENVCRKAVGGWIASFLSSLHRSMGYLIPRTETIEAMKGQTVTTAMIKGKQYKGAVVIQPVAGTYFDCVVVDFGSLYPSIIKNYNIGYESINCPHEECKTNVVADLPHWICRKKRALESIFIGSLRDLRLGWYKKKSKDKNLDEAGKNWYKVVEQTIKVFMNACYGVFASASGFIFYCPSASEEIAGIARYIILQTTEKAKSFGLNVIYGDTDSLVIHKPDREKLKLLQNWAEETWGIDLELDKEYVYMAFSARKKNYIGIKSNGDVDVKGMTGKKSHTPKLFKNTFEEIKKTLGGVHNEQELLSAKERTRYLVQTVYRTLKRRQWTNLDDLAFHVTVNKRIHEYGISKVKGRKCGIPQHIKAVKLLQASGVEFESGSVIAFVKTRNAEGVLPLELAHNEDIDVDKYIEFTKSTFDQILEPLGIDFNDVIGVQKMDQWCK
jgi:DNA polymerase I